MDDDWGRFSCDFQDIAEYGQGEGADLLKAMGDVIWDSWWEQNPCKEW